MAERYRDEIVELAREAFPGAGLTLKLLVAKSRGNDPRDYPG